MFTIGDWVIYRAEGVCRISDIRAESFGAVGNAATYYILTPVQDVKTTLFVPVDNQQLVGMMRPLLSAGEIVALSEELRESRMEWIPESRARSNRFREILAVGDRRELVIMVNTLREVFAQSAKGKKGTGTDEASFHRAAKLLLAEFAATTDLETEAELLEVLSGERVPSPKEWKPFV